MAISSLFGALKRQFRRRPRGASRRARCGLEHLEARLVLSTPGDWPMYNHDISGTRTNNAETILGPGNVAGLHTLWNFQTAGTVAGTPAVVDNVVYAGDTAGYVYAVNSNGT